PPQDGKPLNEDRKRELIDAGSDQAANLPGTDGESVALWNPGWRVDSPPFEGAPCRFPEFAGRRNILMTHPVDRGQPATLERFVDLPPGSRTELTFWVAAHERGDWELRVLADEQLLYRRIVDHEGDRWKQVRLDLSSLAGKRTRLRLENCAND